MIDIIKMTPSIYSKESRDYQLIARLYTALFNLCKLYADNIDVWRINIDNKLSMLRSKTLNFNPTHQWELDDLDTAVSCFKYLCKTKGTKIAIEACVNILMRIQKLTGDVTFKNNMILFEDNCLILKVPESLASVGVVEDLFKYILPTGITYRIINYIHIDNDFNTNAITNNSITSRQITSVNMGIYSETPAPTGNQATTIYRNDVNKRGSL